MESSKKPDAGSAGLLATAQASAYLGVPGPTLAGWRYRGIGPTYVKIGGCIRYRKADLDGYIAQNERKAVAA
ncbi:helix-turn-helix transcriptional regulator [Variovorax paradoxus]|uniref:Helix-turn-helix domain-containing protein n=1 Tax=Variovorax paradoxus (strain EPS) TaxID=595537 RepID=E6V3R2_VARPE|nr:helix-turn-helix domain-containing protein [Variovorax paradoxus]ADU36936.1 hypothetical protein Varpa_2738 [Variovorax paradoxus EPS]